MRFATVLLSWFRTTHRADDMLLERIDMIRGHRLGMTPPARSVFASARQRPRSKPAS